MKIVQSVEHFKLDFLQEKNTCSSAVRPVRCAGAELVVVVFEQDPTNLRLKLTRFPAHSPLPVAALPSVSPIPSARLPISDCRLPILNRLKHGGHGRDCDQDG